MPTRQQKIDTAKQRIRDGTPPPAARYSLPCIHEGAVLEFCPTCSGATAELNHVRDCDLFEKATRGPNTAGVASCMTCANYTLETPTFTDTCPVIKLDEYNLYPNLSGLRFNPSIITWENGYVFCWRNGWKGSNLWVCQMDRSFRPVGNAVQLEIHHPDAQYGREDPNLFVFRGKLHVAFVGVVGVGNHVARTAVLYARLGKGFYTEAVFAPKAPGVDPARWEKNWQWFEYDNELYAVYSIAPHRVLEIKDNRAEWVTETMTVYPWHGGELRGGSSPYKVGNEFYCFFHDKIGRHKLFYRVGVYTFSAEPPFRPLRMTADPVLVADPKTNPGNYCDCIFPRGAVRERDGWVVSCGVHDRFTELHRLTHERVESRLSPLAHCRDGTVDYYVLDSVHVQNEYRIPDVISANDLIIDVGGNFGAFAYAVWKRGARNVHSYEANSANFKALSRNATMLPGVTVYHKAVWSEDDKVLNCCIDQNVMNDWSRYQWCKVNEGDGGEAVTSISLDAIIAGRRVAFLKLDCEGSEFPAILNCRSLRLVDRIAMEVHGNADPLLERLVEFGFATELVRSTDHPDQLALLFARRTP